MAKEWLDSMLNPQISKEAEVLQGKDKQDHFERKVQAHDWIKGVSELDPVAIEAEYHAKLEEEARLLGKVAALDDVIADGVTPEETVNRDYKRDVTSLSDYALAELLAEARGHKAQNTNEMYYELKEKAKAEVASSREKAEKALLEMIPDNAQLDWQKAFKEYTKDATPAEPKEKDLFKSEVPEKAHDFEHPSEDKFKLPKEPEKALPGNGRETDERKEVTEEAGVLKKDIVEGTSKDASQKEAHCGECPGDPGMEQKGAPEELDKEAAPNMEVIKSFVNGQGGASSTNLHIIKGPKGMVLVNYETPIAFRDAKGELYLNNQKYSVTTSKIQTYIRQAAGGQIKEVSPEELEQVMQGPTPEAPAAVLDPSGTPALDTVSAKEPMIEKKADVCPVCGGAGDDMKNGQQNHMSCKECGLTYASASLTATAEITNQASKAEVIKKVAELQKKAEVNSPWIVTTDEQGNEIIARVEPAATNTKESEEDKKEEILK